MRAEPPRGEVVRLPDGRRLGFVERGELDGSPVQLDLAVLGQMFTEELRDVPRSIDDLARVRDADAGWHDHLPTLYSCLAFAAQAKLGSTSARRSSPRFPRTSPGTASRSPA
jgi:hypothetical protein